MRIEADGVMEIAFLVIWVPTEVVATHRLLRWTDMEATASMDRRQHLLLAATMNPPIVTMTITAGGVVVEDAVPTIITNEDIDGGEAGHRHRDEGHLPVTMRTITAIDTGRNETIPGHLARTAV